MNTPTVIKPFGPRRFLTAMSECGRPALTKPMFSVYRAMIAAGAPHGVAFRLTLVAYDAASGYSWKIREDASGLRIAMRYAQRDAFPQGQWARVLDYHGAAGAYLDDEHGDVRNWTQLPCSLRAATGADLGVQP